MDLELHHKSLMKRFSCIYTSPVVLHVDHVTSLLEMLLLRNAKMFCPSILVKEGSWQKKYYIIGFHTIHWKYLQTTFSIFKKKNFMEKNKNKLQLLVTLWIVRNEVF